jgi:hypothetical protein
MVSPQEGHIRTGVLSGTNSGPSIAGVEGAYWAMCDSTETGGSATELSATNAGIAIAIADQGYVIPIRTVCEVKSWIERSEFGQHRLNAD